MNRMKNLILFELKKILNNKKAFLFLLVLNMVPIVSSLILLLTYITCRGLGLGDIQFMGMKKAIQFMFTGHFTLFSYIAPFFLALIVGDSFSTEFGRGYMKMLLITPVKRWQVIAAKSVSIITFLLIAVIIGGLILQTDLLIARGITQPMGVLPEQLQTKAMDTSLSMVTASSALQLFVISFIANIMMIGFFTVFSMYFESAILMAFCSLSAILGIHVFYLSSDILKALLSGFLTKGSSLELLITSFEGISKYFCFTRYYTDLFYINTIQELLNGKISIFTDKVTSPLGFCIVWTFIFYLIANLIFARKQVLH